MVQLKAIYLSGPMTGIPHDNAWLFNEWARRLRWKGYVVINPIELDGPVKPEWAECIERDLDAIEEMSNTYPGWCALGTLPEWWKSKGARLEVNKAFELDLPILPVESL